MSSSSRHILTGMMTKHVDDIKLAGDIKVIEKNIKALEDQFGKL